MTNDNKLNRNNIITNTVSTNNKIKLKIHKGIIFGNIIKEPIICISNSLMFDCDNNSEYIPLI